MVFNGTEVAIIVALTVFTTLSALFSTSEDARPVMNFMSLLLILLSVGTAVYATSTTSFFAILAFAGINFVFCFFYAMEQMGKMGNSEKRKNQTRTRIVE